MKEPTNRSHPISSPLHGRGSIGAGQLGVYVRVCVCLFVYICVPVPVPVPVPVWGRRRIHNAGHFDI